MAVFKEAKILKYFCMKEYRKKIKECRKKIKVEDDFIKNGDFSELHLLKKELKIQGRIAGEDTSTD
jgi:hypothetical protein